MAGDQGVYARLRRAMSGHDGILLRGKAEMQHVAVGDDVVLAFQPQLADVARAGFAAALDVIVIRDGLGADEAVLEIRMDHAGGLRGARTLGDGPGARLLRTDGTER